MTEALTLADTNSPTQTSVRDDNPADLATDTPASIATKLAKLRAAFRAAPATTYEQRVETLNKLDALLLRKKGEIAEAIKADFGNRSWHESMVTEVYMVHADIRHTLDHLHEWMEVEARQVSMLLAPGRAELIPQPVGVVGIIAPWNYPVQLALKPLVGALGAGNRAMIKPSELTPKTSELLRRMLREIFSDDEVCVVLGDAELGDAFSRLPFDHLVFTGSTKVGKIVMRNAAENLTPVTLELGGKSPVLIADDYPLAKAVHSTIGGKLFNAGQTCTSPDYVLVPKAKVNEFVELAKATVAKLYPTLESNPDYTSVVHERHYDRLDRYVAEAKESGCEPVYLSAEEPARASRKFRPTLLVSPPSDVAAMREEIFGPVLLVIPYDTLDEAIGIINDRDRPLALYVFSRRDRVVEKVLAETRSGGVTVNDVHRHAVVDDLPFGGIGPSGMGAYHGKEGFEAFSKKRPVFYQSRFNGAAMTDPPYGKAINFLVRLLVGK